MRMYDGLRFFSEAFSMLSRGNILLKRSLFARIVFHERLAVYKPSPTPSPISRMLIRPHWIRRELGWLGRRWLISFDTASDSRCLTLLDDYGVSTFRGGCLYGGSV